MQFYELTAPEYATDHDHDIANPIQMVAHQYVPGIICPLCSEETGGSWASSNRIRVKVPSTSHLHAYLTRQNLMVDDWKSFADTLRQELSIPSWIPITPGAQIGLPEAILSTSRVTGFLHPFPGQLIVQESVVDTLQQAQLTGFQPIRVEISFNQKVSRLHGDIPILYELVITGSAWRVGIDKSYITVCESCGRTSFPDPEWMVIDEQRWDGTDFFHIDHNPNIVVVTERVCQVLEQVHFSNYDCVFLPQS